MANYKVVCKSQRKRQFNKSKHFVRCVICLFFVLVIVLAVTLYRRAITPTLLQIAESRVRAQATKVINDAVCSALTKCNVDDLICVERNNGEITRIFANSIAVNLLARTTANVVQNKLDGLSVTKISVPIGTLSGIPLLTERGATFCVNVSPISAVSCNFTSYFESVGINQTLHRIYVNVNCVVDLIVPTKHVALDCSTPVLVCESLVVGDVPQTYLNGLSLGGS